MRKHFLLKTALSIFLFMVVIASVSQAQSLYKRIGGYDAIAAVTDDFIGRLVTDPSLAKFFGGHGGDSQKKIRMHVINMVCEATGGPCNYTGRDMKTTHKGLAISEADWNTAVGHFKATLKKFNVPAKESDELVAIVGSVKKDIVEK
ncbi:MAG: group 1 truncated hemoglobin [Chitinophagaceae bacterium]|nr:group 1 truncated hemoglobin [Chitinophagaceae bacterium]